jgi:hypothetical protein
MQLVGNVHAEGQHITDLSCAHVSVRCKAEQHARMHACVSGQLTLPGVLFRHFREAVVRVVKLNGWRMRMKLGALRALMCRSAEEHEVRLFRHPCLLVTIAGHPPSSEFRPLSRHMLPGDGGVLMLP